ncbi:fungal-specific transcription factor domain-containing protein [Biscogniauxia marginata]|nr:fungal-specific transcription factor domain-containing protein [Biscogniauxia marginata]
MVRDQCINMNSETDKTKSSPKRRRPSPDDEKDYSNRYPKPSSPPPKKRRGRRAAACTSCHRRKQRCDGAHPCYNCSRRGVGYSCTYTNLPARADEAPRNKRSSPSPVVSRLDSRAGSPFLQRGSNEARVAGSDAELTPSLPLESSDSNRERARVVGSGPDPQECSVGDLFSSRDAPSFFGSSYFGPQAAAKIIEAPAPDFSSGLSHKAPASATHSFRDEGGPFSQIWELLGLLPRKKSTVDRLTECFLRELNWAIDAVRPVCFREKYETFWSRKFGFDDFATIDLRWLALLFIVLAYGVLLDCPARESKEAQREIQETSLRFYWAARRAIVIAPTFYGESTDLVRAGVLVTRYLIYSRRVPESWLTTSFAMRMAQAQGMHIDGERWRLSRQKTETRRRLWSHLYTLDKTIALAIGRPFAIVDQQCLVKLASNVWLDEMSEDEAARELEKPFSEPTPSLCSRLSHELAMIVGKIQERCFGLFSVSYDAVLALDDEIVAWEARLPACFKLDNPDRSKDGALSFLSWNRLHIHSMYHFTRVTLHRPFLLRQSITDRYRRSHDACISSACADLDMRLTYFGQPLADRFKWTLGPHHLFNSALVLGIIVVRDPHSRRAQAILEDLAAYCEMQRNDVWTNEFAIAEVKIVELCIKKARQMWMVSHDVPSAPLPPPATVVPSPALATRGRQQAPTGMVYRSSAAESQWDGPLVGDSATNPFNFSTVGGPTMWDDPSYSFPEAGDILQWEHVLNSIMQDQLNP